MTKSAEIVGGRPEKRCAIVYANTVATMMTMPPIVGVPRFVWCEVGPSSLMTCPNPRLARKRIRSGVPKSEKRSAIAPAIRITLTSYPLHLIL